MNGAIVAVITLALAVLAHAIVVSRWSARLQTLVEIHGAEIKELRSITGQHSVVLAGHDADIRNLRGDD